MTTRPRVAQDRSMGSADTFDNLTNSSPLTMESFRRGIELMREIQRQQEEEVRRPFYCHSLDDFRAMLDRAGYDAPLHYQPPHGTQPARFADVPVIVSKSILPGSIYRLTHPIPTQEEVLREMLNSPLAEPIQPPVNHTPWWAWMGPLR